VHDGRLTLTARPNFQAPADVILRRVAFRESSGATPGETKAGEADAEQRERGVTV
jgi:hypothetical protein